MVTSGVFIILMYRTFCSLEFFRSVALEWSLILGVAYIIINYYEFFYAVNKCVPRVGFIRLGYCVYRLLLMNGADSEPRRQLPTTAARENDCNATTDIYKPYRSIWYDLYSVTI